MAEKCSGTTEVYSRVCGFFRPVQGWNKGKKEEYKDRKPFLDAFIAGEDVDTANP